MAPVLTRRLPSHLPRVRLRRPRPLPHHHLRWWMSWCWAGLMVGFISAALFKALTGKSFLVELLIAWEAIEQLLWAPHSLQEIVGYGRQLLDIAEEEEEVNG